MNGSVPRTITNLFAIPNMLEEMLTNVLRQRYTKRLRDETVTETIHPTKRLNTHDKGGIKWNHANPQDV